MKKGFNFIVILFILTSIGVNVNAITTGAVSAVNPGHNSTQVYVQIENSKYITLQTAIDYGYLLGKNSTSLSGYAIAVNSLVPYEYASQILITISGKTMTLQEAISHNVFVAGATQSYTTTVPAGGELASSINVNTTASIKTLQYAIQNNLLSSVVIPSSSCPSGYTCPSGNNDGNPCYPSNTLGSLDCGGAISSGTCTNFVSKGTACQASNNDWHSCDGIGHCAGYVGTYGNGCSDCPFGSSGNNCILTGSLFAITPTIAWQGRSAPAPGGSPYSSWSYSSLQCQYDCNCGWLGCDTCKDFIWMKP